jgi:hypothetical protein
MYYKVMKNNKVIDVLDNLIYLKWQPKHKTMILCDEDDAQAILSSDNNTIWHEQSLYEIPTDKPEFDTVELVEIDKYEYKQLKMLNGKTAEEIADEIILSLLENGII